MSYIGSLSPHIFANLLAKMNAWYVNDEDLSVLDDDVSGWEHIQIRPICFYENEIEDLDYIAKKTHELITSAFPLFKRPELKMEYLTGFQRYEVRVSMYVPRRR